MHPEHTSNPRLGQFWTINFLLRDAKVCLAEHTRGPGKGYLNGYGGKGEPWEDAAYVNVREILDESLAEPVQFEERGIIHFHFNGIYMPTHVFLTARFKGEPRATEEMANPRWFAPSHIPYGERMWPGDEYWLPEILEGKRVDATLWIRGRQLERVPVIRTS